MLDSIIAQRRNGEGFQQDFLESLLKKHSRDSSEEKDNDDDKLTDNQLKDNILTLLVAGHDTTTAALTWLVKFLAENPTVLERLRVISKTYLVSVSTFNQKALSDTIEIDDLQEEHQNIKNNREGSSLTWAEVNNMPYTAKVSQHSFFLDLSYFKRLNNQNSLLSKLTGHQRNSQKSYNSALVFKKSCTGLRY